MSTEMFISWGELVWDELRKRFHGKYIVNFMKPEVVSKIFAKDIGAAAPRVMDAPDE